MLRHNRGISLPTNEDEGNKNIFSKIGFFTAVGGVMAALSLKERWDACKRFLFLLDFVGQWMTNPDLD